VATTIWFVVGMGMECCYKPTHWHTVPDGAMRYMITGHAGMGEGVGPKPASMVQGGFASVAFDDVVTMTYYDQNGTVLYTAPRIPARSEVSAELAAPAGTCIYPGGQCWELALNQCKGSDVWTLHGLWAEWANGCSGPAFDVTLLEPIRDQLESLWPSCFGETTEEFWRHEWQKHGTCSGMSQLEYFQKALNLTQSHSNECEGIHTCSICFSKDFSQKEQCSNGQSMFFA